jgi:anti-anti-sigma factor
MIMRAKHETNVLIFELEGQLDFETTLQFRETCTSLMKKNNAERVVFNMGKLKFVGSSGINQFIRVLKEFNSLKLKPRYCNLSSEFQKVFKAYQAARNPFEIFETEVAAVSSFETAVLEPTEAPIARKNARRKIAEI